jgi:hypothetical protein
MIMEVKYTGLTGTPVSKNYIIRATHVTCGTTAGGMDILADTTLTGLTAVGKKFTVQLSGILPSIAGDKDTLDVSVTTADSGTSGKMSVYLYGHLVSGEY